MTLFLHEYVGRPLQAKALRLNTQHMGWVIRLSVTSVPAVSRPFACSLVSLITAKLLFQNSVSIVSAVTVVATRGRGEEVSNYGISITKLREQT